MNGASAGGGRGPGSARTGAGAGGARAKSGRVDRVVLAAGCVLWRPASGADGIELALVHRPKWQDWSHPKGKLKQKEDARRAAVREVLEETGMTCALGTELSTVQYCVEGRPKQVRYWAAEATGGVFAPSREVDRMVWLPPAEAREWVTRERDRELVDVLLGVLAG